MQQSVLDNPDIGNIRNTRRRTNANKPKKQTITQITKMMSSTFTRWGIGRGLTCGIA
jgi:hypothetical protein